MNSHPDDLSARLRASLPAQEHELPTDIVTGAATRKAPHLTHPARRVAAAGGTLVVASLAVAALVVSLPLQHQAPLFTASGSSGSPMSAASGEASSDMRIAAWVNYEYVPGSGLSTSGGNGNVYQLKRVGNPQDRAHEVAAAFGLSGNAAKSQWSDPAYPTWVVGPEDGTGPSVVVSWSGTGNWWYNDPSANPVAECEAASAGGGSAAPDAAETIQSCVDKEPTLADSLAPSEAEAKAKAHDLLALTGFDVPAKSIHVTADAWQTMATANLVVDGTATAIDFGVAWSASGKLSWAYGHSIKVVDRGNFGTVSASDSVERIADGRWFGAGGPDYQGGMNILAAGTMMRGNDASVSSAEEDVADEEPTDPAAPTEPTEPATPTAPVTDPGTEPVPDPSTDPSVDPVVPVEPTEEPTAAPEPTVEPAPEPEKVVVTVDNAEATLLLMWDSEGNAWLVPGFAMKTPEGWWNTIVSLVEGVIELPAPVAIEPYVIDPAVQ